MITKYKNTTIAAGGESAVDDGILYIYPATKIDAMIHEIESIEPREIVKGYRARFIHTEKLTIAFWEVEAGAVMPRHNHLHEQTTQVLEGRFELTVDGVSTVYEPGMVGIIPPFAQHGGVALTNCKILDIFSPVREDYR